MPGMPSDARRPEPAPSDPDREFSRDTPPPQLHDFGCRAGGDHPGGCVCRGCGRLVVDDDETCRWQRSRSQDHVDLGVDVSTHAMGAYCEHADGRLCGWHERMGAWVGPDFTSECLRPHPSPRPRAREVAFAAAEPLVDPLASPASPHAAHVRVELGRPPSCGDLAPVVAVYGGVCIHPVEHKGMHRDEHGMEWEHLDATRTRVTVPAPRVSELVDGRVVVDFSRSGPPPAPRPQSHDHDYDPGCKEVVVGGHAIGECMAQAALLAEPAPLGPAAASCGDAWPCILPVNHVGEHRDVHGLTWPGCERNDVAETCRTLGVGRDDACDACLPAWETPDRAASWRSAAFPFTNDGTLVRDSDGSVVAMATSTDWARSLVLYARIMDALEAVASDHGRLVDELREVREFIGPGHEAYAGLSELLDRLPS